MQQTVDIDERTKNAWLIVAVEKRRVVAASRMDLAEPGKHSAVSYIASRYVTLRYITLRYVTLRHVELRFVYCLFSFLSSTETTKRAPKDTCEVKTSPHSCQRAQQNSLLAEWL